VLSVGSILIVFFLAVIPMSMQRVLPMRLNLSVRFKMHAKSSRKECFLSYHAYIMRTEEYYDTFDCSN